MIWLGLATINLVFKFGWLACASQPDSFDVVVVVVLNQWQHRLVSMAKIDESSN